MTNDEFKYIFVIIPLNSLNVCWFSASGHMRACTCFKWFCSTTSVIFLISEELLCIVTYSVVKTNICHLNIYHFKPIFFISYTLQEIVGASSCTNIIIGHLLKSTISGNQIRSALTVISSVPLKSDGLHVRCGSHQV